MQTKRQTGQIQNIVPIFPLNVNDGTASFSGPDFSNRIFVELINLTLSCTSLDTAKPYATNEKFKQLLVVAKFCKLRLRFKKSIQ